MGNRTIPAARAASPATRRCQLAIVQEPYAMGRVALVGNLAQPTGGTAGFDLAATAVKHLLELLARAPPGPSARRRQIAGG